MALRTSIVISLVFSLFLVAAPKIFTQIPGGLDETTRTDMGGRNFIVGTVYDPSGQPIKMRMRIRLASLTSREIITTTDDYGKFSFSGLGSGAYTVNIDDNAEFEAMSQQVDIQQPRNAPPESYNVSFRLQPKTNGLSKASVVRSENANVPKKALEHYDKALILSKGGDFRTAIAELKLAIEKYPAFMLALTELGIQQLNLGELEEADKSFEAALKIDPKAYEATINRGIGLFRQKHYAEAEIYLRASLEIKNGSATGHFYLGRALMGLNKLDEAEKELNNALGSRKEQMIEVHRMLTQLYIQKRDYEKALQELETYLSANPTAPDGDHLRGVLKQLQQAVASTKVRQQP
jgi:tetratricopeptide (TPR) repeat protein